MGIRLVQRTPVSEVRIPEDPKVLEIRTIMVAAVLPVIIPTVLIIMEIQIMMGIQMQAEEQTETEIHRMEIG